MKKILYMLVMTALLCNTAMAQRINKKQLEQLAKSAKDANLLKEDDEDFKGAANVSQWASESAVIVSQKTSFDFDKKAIGLGRKISRNFWALVFAIPTLGTSFYWANVNGNETKIIVQENERRKILLQDKFAIEQYSVLYFRLAAEGDAFAARVIKKDGTVKHIEFTDAAHVDNIASVPSLFKSYTDQKFSATYRPDYYKLAVPDIEEGDMIEYEYLNYNSQRYLNNPNYKEFDPVYYLCNRELPVAKQSIEVATEDDRYYVSYKSLKGAPDFTETNAGGKKVYRWVDNNRPPVNKVRYVNRYTQTPSVKFQVVYARNSSRNFVWFKDGADMKKELTIEELGDKAKLFWFKPEKLQSTGDYAAGLKSSIEGTEKFLYKSLKKKGLKEAADEDYIRKAYYLVRSQTMYSKWSDFAFAKIFAGLLDEKDIPYEVIVTNNNHLTNLSNAAFTQELNWLIRCNNQYYANPDEHGNPGEMPAYVSGNNAVRFKSAEKETKVIIEPLPAADTLNNVLAVQINANLDAAHSIVSVDKTVEAKGLVKDEYIDDALAATPFMETDFRNYDGEGMWEGLDAKSEEKASVEFMQQKKEWKEEKPKMMKALAEDLYDVRVNNYNSFRILQDGRSFKKKSLKYNEVFSLEDMVSTAGNDLLINLPILAGGKLARLKREEQTRTLPVDIDYPRTIYYTISFTIPDGYTAKGADGLKKAVVNDAGALLVDARVEGNKLVIDVKRQFSKKELTAQQWPLMQELINASASLSQSKILLKKN